jgi:CHAD domain-containing protein
VAKAAEIELDAGMTFADAAARTVAVRAGEVFEHSEGVLDTSDIERVHAMRVATRRLRAVLEIFAPCFPKDRHAEVLSEVKALADALGERRDPDVQLEGILALEQEMDEADRPGLEELATRLREEQAAGNVALARALQHAEESDLRAQLTALVAEAGTS